MFVGRNSSAALTRKLPMAPVFRTLQTIAISLCGVVVFWLLNLPLPFLFGPMAASLFTALAGVKLKTNEQVSIGARTILGVAVGSSITPTVMGQIPQMLASVALIPPYLLTIAVFGVWYFHKICRFDKPTAYFAAMPGGLQDMVVFGQEAGGDVRALSLIHATRVLVIVTIAPIVLTQLLGANLNNPVGLPANDIPMVELALMVFAAFVGWKGGQKLGLFGASILGPMIVSGVLAIFGFISFRPPSEAILFAQFFIGMGIGVGYVGITIQEIRRYVSAGILYVLVLTLIAFVFTQLVIYFGLASSLDSFLAFWPGGQAEMTVLAIIAGADLGYIVVHHLTRIVLVITGAPLFGGMLGYSGKRRKKDSDE